MAAASAVLVLAIMPAAAQAVQRYAAPSGTGTECTQATPCALSEAAGAAKAGDEVIVTPGAYTLSSPLFPAAVTNVQIHGEAGAPMPRINAAFGGPAIYLSQTGDSLSYLEIENDANGGVGFLCYGGRIERLKVRVVGSGGSGAIVLTDCTVRNSLLRVEGVNSVAVRANGNVGTTSAVLRNVTAIASGSTSVGVSAEYTESVPGSFTIELENSIVQGGEADLKPVEAAGAKGPGNIAASHSNFDSSSPSGGAKVIDNGGNQTAAPLFVNGEAGDFREAAGSPTIDAGINDQVGPLDLAGTPRLLGSAPDIGAYEFVPLPAELRSLTLKPTKFRAAPSGEAVISAKKKKKKKPPIGSTVNYELTNPGTIEFSLERGLLGRRVAGKCVKATHANRSHKACTTFKPIAGGFSISAAAGGANHFKFSGRIGGKALKPGAYRITGKAGSTQQSAAFTIVK